MKLYGWDSRTETWHGPNEIRLRVAPARHLLNALRGAGGTAWHGPVRCCASGELPARLFALVHDLSDCAIAAIYCDESKAGPVEILAVLPPERRAHLRAEFALEFLAFTRFLGVVRAGAELQVHDGIDTAIADAGGSDTLVFSVSGGLWPSDMDHVLSQCVEKVVVALCRWLQEPSMAELHQVLHGG